MDLGILFDDLHSLSRASCETKNIEMKLDLADQVPRFVQGDYLRIKQVFDESDLQRGKIHARGSSYPAG